MAAAIVKKLILKGYPIITINRRIEYLHQLSKEQVALSVGTYLVLGGAIKCVVFKRRVGI